MNRFVNGALFAATATIACAGTAHAQDFPVKPVRLVVGLAPGGGTDIVARLVGGRMAADVGQQVMIENRPGASGNIAAEVVARATPDGYTLVIVTASHAINPSLFSKMSYDPIKDFAPITQLTAQPYLFVVHPSVPAKSVKDFIALAKKRKGGMIYASSGAGLLGHLGMELLMVQGGFQATHVPYKGANPALMDTITGQVDAFLPTIISGMPQVKNGRLRAIGVTTLNRSSLLPDLQTVAEQGFKGFEVSGWYGALAPAGTPKHVVSFLHGAFSKALHSADVKQKLVAQGADPIGSSPEAFAAYLASEKEKWAKVVERVGARVD